MEKGRESFIIVFVLLITILHEVGRFVGAVLDSITVTISYCLTQYVILRRVYENNCYL